MANRGKRDKNLNPEGTAIEWKSENETTSLGAKEIIVGIDTIINCLMGIFTHW